MAAVRVLGWGAQPEPAREEPLPVPGALELESALVSPRVATIRSLWLPGDSAATLLSGGELTIRRFIKLKQRKADHHQAYDLSVLEASLLVEYGLRFGAPALIAEEGARLLRFASGSGR